MLGLKIAFIACLVVLFVAGIVTLKNFDRWFGMDPEVPSDNESAAFLNKSQVVLIWVLGMHLLLMMVCIL